MARFLAVCGLAVLAVGLADQASKFGGRKGVTLNVTAFGAVGDNMTLNTPAFERAVAAIRKAGGGTLVVPEGVFVTAPFNLTSHMTLFIVRGGAVVGPSAEQLGPAPQFPLWPVISALPSYGQGRDHRGPLRRAALVGGYGLEDVRVTGDHGIIDGRGGTWWECAKRKLKECQKQADGVNVTRGHLVELAWSKGVEVSNLRLFNSPFWTVHPYDCDGVVVRNLFIWAPLSSPNTDGIDPDSSRNVLIENFTYYGGDDAIAIKSGWDCFGYRYGKPTRDVVVRGVKVVASRSAGCAIGSEMSGGMQNISVGDCDFAQARWGVDIKYSRTRGGYVRDIRFKNISLGNIHGSALTISGGYGDPNPSCSGDIVPCPVDSVLFEDVRQAHGTFAHNVLDFEGLPSNSITNVQLRNVRLSGSSICRLVNGTFDSATTAAANCPGLRPEGHESFVV